MDNIAIDTLVCSLALLPMPNVEAVLFMRLMANIMAQSNGDGGRAIYFYTISLAYLLIVF